MLRYDGFSCFRLKTGSFITRQSNLIQFYHCKWNWSLECSWQWTFKNMLIYARKLPNNSVSDGLWKMINTWQFLISESHLGLLAAGIQKSILMNGFAAGWLQVIVVLYIHFNANIHKTNSKMQKCSSSWKIASHILCVLYF